MSGALHWAGVGACYAASAALAVAAFRDGRRAAVRVTAVPFYVGPVEEAADVPEARVLEVARPYDFPGPARPGRHRGMNRV